MSMLLFSRPGAAFETVPIRTTDHGSWIVRMWPLHAAFSCISNAALQLHLAGPSSATQHSAVAEGVLCVPCLHAIRKPIDQEKEDGFFSFFAMLRALSSEVLGVEDPPLPFCANVLQHVDQRGMAG